MNNNDEEYRNRAILEWEDKMMSNKTNEIFSDENKRTNDEKRSDHY